MYMYIYTQYVLVYSKNFYMYMYTCTSLFSSSLCQTLWMILLPPAPSLHTFPAINPLLPPLLLFLHRSREHQPSVRSPSNATTLPSSHQQPPQSGLLTVFW